MPCPVHAPTANADDSDDRVTPDIARAPEIERLLQRFLNRWRDRVRGLASSLTQALRMGAIDLTSLESISADVSYRFGEWTNDIEILFREHSTDAARAGREVAIRRYGLDVSFDIYNERILDILDHWPVTASKHVADTIEDDVVHYLKGAQKEGLSIPKIADQFQEEYVDGKLKGWKAEQIARDATISPSRAGSHSSYNDAESVGATKWYTAHDSRVRRTHRNADGQVVAVSTPFIVGDGYRAAFPGDPSLPVRLFTQCRCVEIPVFSEQLTKSQWATVQSGGRVWV